MDESECPIPRHHVRLPICATRKKYRDGRRDTAVKVYTVSQESKYLMIIGVPAVGAGEELVKLCALYGQVDEYRILDEYPNTEPHTEVYWVKFNKIQAARVAKRRLDDYSFFGGVLHVFYAPEYETTDDTRQKLVGRRRWVAAQIKRLNAESQKPAEENTQPPAFIDVIEPTEKPPRSRPINGHVSVDQKLPTNQRPEYKSVPPPLGSDRKRKWTEPEMTPSGPKRERNMDQRNEEPSQSVLEFHPSRHGMRFSDDLSSYPSNQYMGSSHFIDDMTLCGNVSRKSRRNERPSSKTGENPIPEKTTQEKKNPDEVTIHGVKVKPFVAKTTPRFVPRQVKSVPKPESIAPVKKRDDLDEIIKKNAYVLGPVAGPAPRPGAEKPTISKEEESIMKTRAAISEKLKKLCPTLVPRQVRKRKLPDSSSTSDAVT